MEQHPNYTIPKLGPKVFWDLLLVGIYFWKWHPGCQKEPFFIFFGKYLFGYFLGFFWIVFGLLLVSRKDALGPFTRF